MSPQPQPTTLVPPPLGLYIHLPWCERKCPYCDFNSHETRVIPQEEYVDALLRDLEGDLELARGRSVTCDFGMYSWLVSLACVLVTRLE